MNINQTKSSSLSAAQISPKDPNVPQAIDSSGASFSEVFASTLKELSQSWKSTQLSSSQMLKSLPAEFQGYVRLQREVSQLHLQVEFGSKVADGFQSAIKKVSQ